MRRKYIGVFDSGLGGLTTVSEIIRQLPGENIVFLGDTANIPYGSSKSREEIIALTMDNMEKLSAYDLKALIIACNTADCNASESVRRKYPNIPVFAVIAPAAKKAAETSENHRIGILATDSTVASGKYEEEICSCSRDSEIFSVPCPKLVPMIETGVFIDDPGQMKKVLLEYLEPLKEKDIDTLILGCTHYDIMRDMVSEILPGVNIVSSSRCVIEDLKQYLKQQKKLSRTQKAKRIYLVTSDPKRFTRMASLLINDIEIKKAN